MPSEAAPAFSDATSSFAKLFAGLARTKTSQADRQPDAWDEDALAEDVATISYEQALRAHARYRRAEPLPAAPIETPDIGSPKPPQSVRITEWVPNDTPAALAATRKLSSVTIRMSRTEYEQLRERAAAAGVTVSGYLRSCIFEVETLRAQVKDALSELHAPAAQAGAGQEVSRSKLNSSADWRSRLFARWSRNRHYPDA